MSWALAAVTAVPLVIYAVELLAGLRPGRYTLENPIARSIAILLPAHNEAAGVAVTLEKLRAVAPPTARVLVVADNCTDDTAGEAARAGAEVHERRDEHRRGKGFALAFGRDILARRPPDVVIVLDADCEVTNGSIERLAAVADKGLVAQAPYLLVSERNASALVQISNFAMLIKNVIRSRGVFRLGGSTFLAGTGTAFPWKIFAAAPLGTPDIVEDLTLSIALARGGVRTRLVDQALVLSKAAGVSESKVQRTRWEHGFLASALRQAIPLLLSGLVSRSRAIVALGLHLLVPPLALLMLLSMGVLVILTTVGALASTWEPFILLSCALSTAILLTALAWLAHGRQLLPFSAMIKVPLYLAWKAPLYLRFLVSRETNWRRTPRDGEL